MIFKLDFDISYNLRFGSINLSINLLPPTSGDINARGGSMSSSYVVKYTMNGDSPISIRLLLKKKENHPPPKKQESPTQTNR